MINTQGAVFLLKDNEVYNKICLEWFLCDIKPMSSNDSDPYNAVEVKKDGRVVKRTLSLDFEGP
jgi:hypothetical protein